MTSSPRIGINHHVLFPESMTDPAAHEATLRTLLSWPEFTAVDLYCAGNATQRVREAAIIRASGKTIVYNPPLLATIPGCDPNARDSDTIARTRSAILPHLDAAAACGARMTNIASGLNPPPEQRAAAWEGWIAFLEWYARKAKDRLIDIAVEPFDSSIGKNLLIGPTTSAVRAIGEVRARGVTNAWLMVDMGHLPIMGETFEHAIRRSSPYLRHVHLGNAVVRDPSSPWYGDMHPPFGIPGGEHDEGHLAEFLGILREVGYLDQPGAVLTLEMRPYPGLDARESVAQAGEILDRAWNMTAHR